MENRNFELEFEGKNLPFSNEAEQSVIGSILIDAPSINLVLDRLKPEHFYIPQNREIFEILVDMTVKEEKIDFITVLEKMRESGKFDETGGKAYISNLVSIVPTSANIGIYADIVRERYYSRSLIVASRDIIERAQGGADAKDALEYAEEKIFSIRDGKEISGLKPIGDVITTETFDRLQKMTNPETRKDYLGIPTGFSELDRKITGLNKSDLIVIGARPGMGKTAFALNIARNVAVGEKKSVVVFSLEMSRDQLAQRILSSEALIESYKLRTANLTSDEWTRLADAGAVLHSSPLYLDETSNITVPEMKAKIRRMDKLPDVIIIDYIGLMHSATKKENRVQEISEITRSLKILAKELRIPVIICAQLNREVDSKQQKSHKPQLSDLRESGSIEQDADIVLFLYRPQYYKNGEDGAEQNPEDATKAEVIVAKNRHGELGSVQLHWDGQYTKYSSVEDTYNYGD